MGIPSYFSYVLKNHFKIIIYKLIIIFLLAARCRALCVPLLQT